MSVTHHKSTSNRLCGLIVRVRVVPRRTVVGDTDRRFHNLSGSHHQSHVNCASTKVHRSALLVSLWWGWKISANGPNRIRWRRVVNIFNPPRSWYPFTSFNNQAPCADFRFRWRSNSIHRRGKATRLRSAVLDMCEFIDKVGGDNFGIRRLPASNETSVVRYFQRRAEGLGFEFHQQATERLIIWLKWSLSDWGTRMLQKKKNCTVLT